MVKIRKPLKKPEVEESNPMPKVGPLKKKPLKKPEVEEPGAAPGAAAFVMPTPSAPPELKGVKMKKPLKKPEVEEPNQFGGRRTLHVKR
jgi:hypothetical protein